MRSVTLALSAVLFLSGALTAQEHSHPVPPVAPTGAGASANPDIIRLDRSEELLAAIRSTAGEKDAAALRSAAEAYVSYISALRSETSRFPRAEGSALPDRLAIGKKVALQATHLDSLAKAVPGRLRKDVERALAAADGLLGTLARGWTSPEARAEAAGPAFSKPGSSGGHH